MDHKTYPNPNEIFPLKGKEGDIYAAQRLLHRGRKLILDKGGVEIPFPQVVVHTKK